MAQEKAEGDWKATKAHLTNNMLCIQQTHNLHYSTCSPKLRYRIPKWRLGELTHVVWWRAVWLRRGVESLRNGLCLQSHLRAHLSAGCCYPGHPLCLRDSNTPKKSWRWINMLCGDEIALHLCFIDRTIQLLRVLNKINETWRDYEYSSSVNVFFLYSYNRNAWKYLLKAILASSIVLIH